MRTSKPPALRTSQLVALLTHCNQQSRWTTVTTRTTTLLLLLLDFLLTRGRQRCRGAVARRHAGGGRRLLVRLELGRRLQFVLGHRELQLLVLPLGRRLDLE